MTIKARMTLQRCTIAWGRRSICFMLMKTWYSSTRSAATPIYLRRSAQSEGSSSALLSHGREDSEKMRESFDLRSVFDNSSRRGPGRSRPSTDIPAIMCRRCPVPDDGDSPGKRSPVVYVSFTRFAFFQSPCYVGIGERRLRSIHA